MWKNKFLALTVILAAVVATATATGAEVFDVARVVRVIDGDTIEVSSDVRGVRRVRLIGVDAAPLRSRWIVGKLGEKAADFTRDALLSNDVILEYDDVASRDEYGRDLAYIWEQSPDIWPREIFNAKLLLAGHALVLRVPPNVKYSKFFAMYQREAMAEGVGRWALSEDIGYIGDWGNIDYIGYSD
jgi:micrococcal nuclease